MAVYFVAQIRIDDDEEYQRYLDGVDAVFRRFNGRYLAVDNCPSILEGAWSGGRMVIIEFPDETEFKRWYHSPEYQQILQYRLRAAQCVSMLVRGLPG